MDDYILNILSEWQINKDVFAARRNLLQKAQSFPDLRFVAVACLLKIGDLYAEKGDRKTAKAFYLKIAKETSSDMSQYRMLAERRLRGLRPARP